MNQVTIYIHGSCHFLQRLENDEAVGNGGYGIVITENGQIVDEVSGGFSNTTNARMDIMGIIEGLKRINQQSDIVVYLTNGYVIDTLSKGWLEQWKKNGYKKKKHPDLWKRVDTMLQENIHSISFKHAKEIKNTVEFQRAEQLGKMESAKKKSS